MRGGFWLTSAAVVLTVVSLSACTSSDAGKDEPPSASPDRLQVATTFTVLADMVKEVGGEHVDVASITRPGAEIHGYEPTPSDIRNAANADLVIVNGLGLDDWFTAFTEASGAPHITATDGIEVIPIANGEYAGYANPHAWMAPSTGMRYVDNIATALSEADPAHSAEYRANADAYNQRLAELDQELVSKLAELPESQRSLVTCEGAFSYLARSANLQERYLWPVNAEKQSTPRRVADVIDYVRDNSVQAVFCESTVSPQSQQLVADEGGAQFGGTLYVDSLSDEAGPVPTYYRLLEHDVRTIVDGLRAGSDASQAPQ